jgi:DNA-binding CsgD family transcriptional regulator
MPIFERSPVPMVLVDEERRYVAGNLNARLALRLSLDSLRKHRIEDLTPPQLLPVLHDAWTRLIETGCMAGPFEVLPPDGGRLPITYYAVSNAVPGYHLIAFAPADWPEGELVGADGPDAQVLPRLTPRELQVLELAADGRNGPKIAEELFVSPATVQTHFEHIYAKLGVRDRAAAVARALRLGLII